jgi:signal transduction protein with GAF and PtsI domain
MEKASLNNLLGIICSVFDAYSAVLFLPGQDPEVFHPAAVFSLGDKVQTDSSILPGQGLVGWIIRNRRPLLINNFDQKRSRLGYYPPGEEVRIKAFMGCALRREEGALCLDSMRTHSFSQKDQKILELFAGLVSDIRFESKGPETICEEEQLYRSLNLLHGLRIKFPKWTMFLKHYLDVVSSATGFENCFLAVRDEHGEGYFLEGSSESVFVDHTTARRKFPIGSGLIGWVFNNHSPVFLEKEGDDQATTPLFGKNVEERPWQSACCLPLSIYGKTRGVLVLTGKGKPQVSEQKRLFMDMTADYLAMFLENLYMKNRLTERPSSS